MPVLTSSRESFAIPMSAHWMMWLIWLVYIVNESAACNLCPLVGTQDGQTIVPSRDWAGFLSSHFRRLDGIKQYHHFRFERDHPGVVFLKKTATAEEETRCLLLGDWSPSLADKPPLVPATGLSLERRRYVPL